MASRAPLVLACSLLASACGAKTGLDAPDVGSDAGVDAATDTGVDSGRPPVPCFEAPRELGEVTADLDVPAALAVVDIMFVIDSTGSMSDEIEAVRAGLRDRLVPDVRALIPDAAFGVALFGEFPVEPYGPRRVRPYELRAPITSDVTRIEAALDGTPTWGNFDDPEASIEAVYQVVTGEGLGMFISPSIGCPGGGFGGVCYRPDALPILMLITDAPMHNGPPDVPPVDNYDFEAHGYRETVDAVNRLDVLVLGLGATDRGRPTPLDHLRALTRDTGSVDARGEPLTFDIGSGGDRIGADIVAAVRRVAMGVPLDVDALAEDIPGDAVDAADVLRGVVALRADPPGNVASMDGDTFLGVVPGTLLTFRIVIDASDLPPSPTRRVYPARVVFRASRRSRLEVREIEIVVPGDDGSGCDDDT